MNETDIDALVRIFSPEEWSVKIREGMNRLGLYFEGDETEMNKKAEKQAKEKLDKWLKEMEPNEERHCDKDYCELVKEQHKND